MDRSLTPWKKAQLLILRRHSLISGQVETLDPGVNFFVLGLEQMGLKTVQSCEGHPGGFYIWFQAPLEIAQEIADAGYFSVQLNSRPRGWTLSLNERGYEIHNGDWNDEARQSWLENASQSWIKNLGTKIP